MAVVKGMLLVKADTRADTHRIKMMATVNWCCIGTLWVGGGGAKHSLLSQNNKIQAQCNMIIGSVTQFKSDTSFQHFRAESKY